MSKKGKPFFFRVDAADFVSAVLQIPKGKHEEWVQQLAIDLVSGNGTMDYSTKLISEANEYRRIQAESGSRGGKAKSSKPKGSVSKPKAKYSDPLASSSNTKEIYKEKVSMTKEEHSKLVQKYGPKKTELAIDKLSLAKMANAKLTYTSDYHAILKWVMSAVEKELENFILPRGVAPTPDNHPLCTTPDWL